MVSLQNPIVKVRLEPREYAIALQVGVDRRCEARRNGMTHRWKGDPRYSEQMDMMGAVAEACVAKYLNLYWLGGSKGQRDVGICEVRAKFQSDHCLLLHREDADDAPFISVAVRDGVGLLCGWVLCRDAKVPAHWKDPTGSRPAFFVPNEALNPICTLKDFLNQTIDPIAGAG